MTTKPYIWLNEPYMLWLLDQVSVDYRRKAWDTDRYKGLFEALWDREFVWTVPNDGNRLADGLELRYLFLIDEDVKLGRKPPSHADVERFRGQACRMLEVIVALARRLNFNTDREVGWWSWKLIDNLGLALFKEPMTDRKRQGIDEALDTLIFRTYKWDGDGGFFPLKYPKDNQTRVEVWYQMAAYLEEQHYI
jgi:hypothetical protein